jgi:lipoprotein-releasing system permease protein
MSGSFESFVAHRYLNTRKKGAFVRIMVRFARCGIAVGVFGLVVALALMNGFREEIQANLFSATAHFSVFHLLGDVPDTEQVLAKVRAVPGVVAASPTRLEQGLFRPTRGDASPEALMVKAVDPATAHGTSSIFDSLKPGPVEHLHPGEIIIGAELQRNLGLKLGDDVAIAFFRLDLGLSGIQPRMVAFKVAGVFESHNGEYDKRWAFIPLEDAKAIALSDEAEFIEVRTKGADSIDGVKQAVLQSLNEGQKGLFRASDLRETNKSLFAALTVQKWISGGILALIVLIAAFNIVASLVLLVTEKRRDLGVLLSLGATPRQIQRLFELQGLRIGAEGTAWGIGLSVPFCLLADHYKLVKLPSAVYDFITYVPFRLSVWDMLLVAVFPLLVAWWASRYPAKRASRVDPVDALRAE